MNTEQILTLLCLPKVGRTTTIKVIQKLTDTDPNFTWESIYSVLRKMGKTFTSEEVEHAMNTASTILNNCREKKIHVLGFNDPRFPIQLRTIPDPPAVIYVKGNLDALDIRHSVAIIGTRDPSNYGKTMAMRLGQVLAERNLKIVSGLAVGCDAAAHWGCVTASGQGIIVLAHGLDRIYPAENRELADEILTLGGCLIGEYPPGEKPRRNYFVERDRLQSGLSSAVVVVETDIVGGTMHTVNFAIKQDRLLACLDHPQKYANQKSNGNRMLIKKGLAMRLGTSDDLEEFLNMLHVYDHQVNLDHGLTKQLSFAA